VGEAARKTGLPALPLSHCFHVFSSPPSFSTIVVVLARGRANSRSALDRTSHYRSAPLLPLTLQVLDFFRSGSKYRSCLRVCLANPPSLSQSHFPGAASLVSQFHLLLPPRAAFPFLLSFLYEGPLNLIFPSGTEKRASRSWRYTFSREQQLLLFAPSLSYST